ncbi:Averufin oxidase A [Aspergillus ustus]|uniref:Averufin oxidase A n=1 Tax=Aspergillus ustus TaxID=40382 RepID=A0A0C1EG53_ASPUT|nr:Averufin oxidase A [Aspergillus ustus]
MPTYALLGATGATGSSVLRHLLNTHRAPNANAAATSNSNSNPNPSLNLNILVRSKPKLLFTFPTLESHSHSHYPTNSSSPGIQIQITEGSATDPTALDSVLHSACIIFMCVATNDSTIGRTLTQDTASAILASLRRLRHSSKPRSLYVTPTLIQLRSASLNPPLAAQVPRFVSRAVRFCLAAQYADLAAACASYEQAARDEKGLLEYVLVDPPTLHDAFGHTPPTGHRLIEDNEKERQAICLSYADLGVALCEVAGRAGEYKGRAVGVTATGGVRMSWGVLAGYLFQGGVTHLVYRCGGGENVVVVAGCIVLVVVACLIVL